MKQNYSAANGGTSGVYSPPPFKPGSPTMPKLPHSKAFTNSSKEIGMKKDDFIQHKFPNSPTYKKFSQASPNKVDAHPKNIPPFIQNKNSTMKGSMYVGDSLVEGSPKFAKHDKNGHHHKTEKPKRMPRMSQTTNHQEMRASNVEFHNENNKVPAFLQEKQDRSTKNSQTGFNKKIPFPSDPTERPESSKEVIGRLKEEIANQGSLSSSYGLMKQSKIEEKSKSPDPTTEWVKKSWCKKKQRKIEINDFEQIKQLGAGKYGQVFLAKEKKTNFICALKIIEKNLLKEEEITQQFIRQLKIQTYLNHPNIIKMFGFFDDAVNIYIILEVGTGGQLFKQLKKHQCMPEQKVASLMRQICEAVNELHSNRIIHRDIKPENIVLHDNVVKLCDFGWSVHRDQNMRKTFCGTPLYVCPEILRGREYDEKIDIWSLGVMMYEMLVGQNPFKITKEEQLIKIVKDNISIPSYVDISPEGKSFVDSCLQKNPDQRSNIRELLAHEFFKKHPQKNDKKMGL